MWFNPFMRWLLRSPLHGMVSKQMMLITYTGRKSGKTYTTPVNYIRAGDLFLTISYQQRTWWRNLRGGVPVTLRVQGQELKARAEVCEQSEAVSENLLLLLDLAPQYARFLHLEVPAGSRPSPAQLAVAAQGKVVVRAQLETR